MIIDLITKSSNVINNVLQEPAKLVNVGDSVDIYRENGYIFELVKESDKFSLYCSYESQHSSVTCFEIKYYKKETGYKGYMRKFFKMQGLNIEVK